MWLLKSPNLYEIARRAKILIAPDAIRGYYKNVATTLKGLNMHHLKTPTQLLIAKITKKIIPVAIAAGA
jgi:hypothetical protein